MSVWPKWQDNKLFTVVVLLLTVVVAGFLVLKMDQTYKQTQEIGKPTPFEHSIYIEGVGSAKGTADLAEIYATVTTRAESSEVATSQNAEKMNAIIAALGELGVEKADIQTTGYNLYEDWVWNEETQQSERRGWILDQTITVKVRDVAKVGEVIRTATERGATNLSGPTFTLDASGEAKEALKDEARVKALVDAKEKAQALSKELNVELGPVIGYSEWTEDVYPPYPYYDSVYLEKAASQIEPGEQEVILHTSVTYLLIEE